MNFGWNDFFVLISSFSMSLICAELIFCFHLEKRSYFWLRFVTLVLLFLIFTYDMPYYRIWNLPSYRFFLTFLISTVLMFICFKGSVAAVIFCTTAGYATRSLAQNAYLLLRYLFPSEVHESVDPMNYLLFAGIYIVVYYALSLRLRNRNLDIENKPLIAIALVAVVLNEILNLWKWVFRFPDNPICPLFGILSCALVLVLLFQFFQEKALKNEKALLYQLLLKENEKYELSRQNTEMINLKAHDLKHNLAMFNERTAEETVRQYRSDLEKSIADYDDMPNTGSVALDTAIMEKRRSFEETGIEFTYFADGMLLKRLSDVDIYSLFGNILANAYECEAKEPEGNRFIALNVSEKANQLYIHEDNSCSSEVRFVDRMPQTDGDPDYHGFGTKSIRYIVEKYGGILDFSYLEGRFNVDILIPAEG